VTGIAARRYRTVAGRGEAVRLLAASAAMLLLAACSFGVPVPSLSDEPATTQSVAPARPAPLSADLGEEDWRRAKAAMAVALDPQGSGARVTWDNPDSALKGEFTPVGQPFVKADEICRIFLATISGQGTTSNLQGTACRPSGGEWAIKDVGPFRKG
jgi:hypothetical protein